MYNEPVGAWCALKEYDNESTDYKEKIMHNKISVYFPIYVY